MDYKKENKMQGRDLVLCIGCWSWSCERGTQK